MLCFHDSDAQPNNRADLAHKAARGRSFQTLTRMKTSFAHPVLGELTYDAGLNWYEGRLVADGDAGSVYLSLDECEDEEALVALAAAKIAEASRTVRQAKEFSASVLISLKNGEWLGECESAFSEEQFVKKLVLESMVFYPDRTRELTFRDGGLFFGHVVLVSLDHNDECSEAGIAG